MLVQTRRKQRKWRPRCRWERLPESSAANRPITCGVAPAPLGFLGPGDFFAEFYPEKKKNESLQLQVLRTYFFLWVISRTLGLSLPRFCHHTENFKMMVSVSVYMQNAPHYALRMLASDCNLHLDCYLLSFTCYFSFNWFLLVLAVRAHIQLNSGHSLS